MYWINIRWSVNGQGTSASHSVCAWVRGSGGDGASLRLNTAHHTRVVSLLQPSNGLDKIVVAEKLRGTEQDINGGGEGRTRQTLTWMCGMLAGSFNVNGILSMLCEM